MGDKEQLHTTRFGDSASPSEPAGEAPFDPGHLIGQTLDGRYDLEECIGHGGMGVVYLARQRALDRRVVVKVLPPSLVDDEQARARFEREAAGMSRLQHPHVVSIFDFGRHDHLGYIVMEYVEGITLRRLIHQGKAAEFKIFARIALQILSGIGEAHALGLVHRDIKPANIMLTSTSSERYFVKVLDFGLAKLVRGDTDLTRPNGVVGTVSYLSPEQIEGEETDERADVYSLGVVFYYMLCGDKPFAGDDPVAVLYQHVHRQPPRLEERLADDSDVPHAVIELIHRALSKAPEHRPRDAGAFLDEFITCLDGTSVSADTLLDTRVDAAEPTIVDGPPGEPSGPIVRGSKVYEWDSNTTVPPSSSQHAAPTPTTPAEAGDTNDTDSLLALAKNSYVRNVVLAVLTLLVGVGLATFDWESSSPSRGEVRKELDEANALIEAGKLGTAEDQLDLLTGDLEHYPGLRQDYADVHEKLEIAQLLADAQSYEEDGEVAKAEATYHEALRRDPKNKLVIERLLELRRGSDKRDLAERDAAQ